MGDPLLKVQGLCKDFAGGRIWRDYAHVIEHVDMEVHAGEIRGIVGESGSGKTTLARCCLRLLEPSAGFVQFDGLNLADLSHAGLRAKRREFQMIFQNPLESLNSAMTVEEILLEPLEIHKVGDRGYKKRRVRELMEAVSIGESLIYRRPVELSGGQQQRLGIARALALEPRLVIADEPVSALDVSVQAQILNLLAGLKKRYGLTLMMISHSLYALNYLCTSISVMYQGRIVEEAPAAQFFEHPKHPYSRLLYNSIPILDPLRQKDRRRAQPDAIDTSRPRSGCCFHPRCPYRLSICERQIPALTEISPGEKVACFLFAANRQ